MNVKEICGFLDESRGFPADYIAYYHTKIEGRNVIFRRVISLNRNKIIRGSMFEKLDDYIQDIRDFGNNENLLQKMIEIVIAEQEEYGNDKTDIEPIQMQNGRETDLSLANITIYEP